MTESIWRHQFCYKDIILNCRVGCYGGLVITKFLLARAKINSFTVANRTQRTRFMSTYYICASVQTGPGAHPASCTTGTGIFPG